VLQYKTFIQGILSQAMVSFNHLCAANKPPGITDFQCWQLDSRSDSFRTFISQKLGCIFGWNSCAIYVK